MFKNFLIRLPQETHSPTLCAPPWLHQLLRMFFDLSQFFILISVNPRNLRIDLNLDYLSADYADFRRF